jgi:hypothetical protein
VSSFSWNARYLLLLCLALAGCLAFYAWQWRQVQQPGAGIEAPEEGSPEWYRQAYGEVVRQIDRGNLQQARDQLDHLQVARRAAADRLQAETFAAPPTDLHNNALHSRGPGPVSVNVRVPDYRPADAPLGPCQLRIEFLASERNGSWQLQTRVLEPEAYQPLSEEEAGQIRQQARDRVRPDNRPGWTQWSNFVFTRIDCIRASDPIEGEGQ